MGATFSLRGNEVILGSCFSSAVYLQQCFVSMGTGDTAIRRLQAGSLTSGAHTPPELPA